MAATISDNAERIARLETRALYIDRMLEQRAMIMSAHSRRLADIEMNLRDQNHTAVDLTDRVVRLETSQEITKGERLKRDHTKATLQWIATAIVGIAVFIGLFVQGDATDLIGYLGGLIAPQ